MAYTTIDKPTDYFNTVLYTGNATDDRSITGVGFQPDFSWVKRRDSTGSHRLKDSVRGATKTLISNSSNAESTEANVFQAFESDGFQLGSDSALNASGGTYASWNWLAGGTASSNSNGSITSSVSASTTAGFSIVKYTGTGSNATIGHGLGKKPDAIIVKAYEDAQQWASFWSPLGATKVMRFNTTNSASTSSTRWNNTEPTSSVFSVGTEFEVNTNTEEHIAYCFTSIKGYSKIGSFTGNGSTDGTFVYTGFKPAWVIVKESSGTSNWLMFDNKRDISNGVDAYIKANTSDSEYSGTDYMDFLSNGFKCRNAQTFFNESGSTYIYMAFAENPFVTSGGIPCTAR